MPRFRRMMSDRRGKLNLRHHRCPFQAIQVQVTLLLVIQIRVANLQKISKYMIIQIFQAAKVTVHNSANSELCRST